MEETLVSYVLGELSEREQIELESEYFSEIKKFNLLRCVRDEVMDAYVDGKLSQKQRKQFELHLQNFPGHRRQLDFAEVLAKYISLREQADAATAVSVEKRTVSLWQSIAAFLRGANPILQFSFATLVVIAMLGGLWLMNEISRLRTQVNELQSEHTTPSEIATDPKLEQQVAEMRSRADQLTQELDSERSKRMDLEKQLSEKQTRKAEPLLRSLAFFLSPEALRGNEGQNSLVIPSDVPVVELQLNFKKDPGYKFYRAQISNANSEQIWHKDQLKVQKRGSSSIILLSLPSKILAEDDYVIELSATTPDSNYETLSTYTFRVLKK
jgi:anti-sigma factor RsiW